MSELVAAVYARKSNEQDGRDDDSKSVTQQVERAREYAVKRGWKFSEDNIYIDDAVSGAEWAARHAWKRLKADIGRAEVAGDVKLPFHVLIVAAQSRIGRDSTRVPHEISLIEDTGVQIWSYLDDKRISVSTDGDEIMTVFSSIADSFQRKAASKFATDELRRRAQAGKVAGGKIYGYKNVRPHPGAAVERVVDEEQAKVVRLVFDLIGDGWGYARVAKYLNDKKIPGPRTVGIAEQARLREAGEPIPVPTWGLSGVREVANRKLYLTGEYAYGSSKRGRKKSTKIRTKRAEADIIRVQRDDWKVISQDQWDRAHARIDRDSARILRTGFGAGKARTQFVGKPEGSGKGTVYLLSSMLSCGPRIPEGATRPHGGMECGAPLVVKSRGRSKVRSYVCSAFRESGERVCTNNSAVPVEAIDRAVIASMKQTFSSEAFEQHLAERAADTVKIPSTATSAHGCWTKSCHGSPRWSSG
jgi:DNA invertase Pin-like site-specific DNA recombinase